MMLQCWLNCSASFKPQDYSAFVFGLSFGNHLLHFSEVDRLHCLFLSGLTSLAFLGLFIFPHILSLILLCDCRRAYTTILSYVSSPLVFHIRAGLHIELWFPHQRRGCCRPQCPHKATPNWVHWSANRGRERKWAPTSAGMALPVGQTKQGGSQSGERGFHSSNYHWLIVKGMAWGVTDSRGPLWWSAIEKLRSPPEKSKITWPPSAGTSR